MRLPCLLQPRILKQALTALFSRPYTTTFPKTPYEPIPQFRGRPRYNEKECIGCGACAEVCPSKCIDLVDDLGGATPVRRLVQHLDQCIWCGQCERYCPTKEGIKQSTEWDCVGFKREDFEEKVEKELLLCEVCGSVIAPVDQVRWLVKQLGPLAYTNPTVMLVAGRDLAIVDEGVKAEAENPLRADRLMIQCPRCRRKTAYAV
ncbi:MAG: 4Fe-4S dicluster domain-containing protein [Verrucomicrobia bacterium]|nr:4Fe-4S dicluster domain-containing protein [Verrucomicrobiota bacterium]MBU1908778.1 4Fe-4S dicluster domain-containing protein [Verrucomicrobiota bacterium]